tara:strand:- start:4787 stop:6700 length:1914 start_codon:yes stop_codon:yes gene_type:complete
MNKRILTSISLLCISCAYLFAQETSTPSVKSAYTAGYWQQEIDYTMNIVVDAHAHQFTGEQHIIYTNNSPDVIDRVFYHLYFNAFQPGSMMDVRSRTIEDPDSRIRDRIFNLKENEIGYHEVQSLRQDGQELRFNVEGTILQAPLARPLLPGEQTILEMDFESQVPLQIRRSGWNNSEGVEFSMSQWYPKLAEYDYRGWHPNPYIGREFHGIFGRFDVKITIDKDYVVGGTGVLQNPNQVGYGYEDEGIQVNHDTDELTWHFLADEVLDFFWGADPDFIHVKAQVPNGPMLHFLYQDPILAVNKTAEENEKYLEYWKHLPKLIVQAFEYANTHFGTYPYPQFTTIQGGDGGMEYPMGTLITGARNLQSLVGVTVHELYHSWYQNVLATNEALYAWMDEGFTSFASSETMQYLFGSADNPHSGSMRGYQQLVDSGKEEPMATHADHYHTNFAYGRAAYSKGAVYLNQIRYIIGEQAFRSGMLRYHEEWKLKHPTDLDFIRLMEKESGMILDWFHEYFVHTTKTIDYGITSVKGVESQPGVTQIHLERTGLMPAPLDIWVEYTDESKEEFYIPMRIMRGEKPAEHDGKRVIMSDWPWVEPTYSFIISVPIENIRSISIDPTERLADINTTNNVILLNPN